MDEGNKRGLSVALTVGFTCTGGASGATSIAADEVKMGAEGVTESPFGGTEWSASINVTAGIAADESSWGITSSNAVGGRTMNGDRARTF